MWIQMKKDQIQMTESKKENLLVVEHNVRAVDL